MKELTKLRNIIDDYDSLCTGWLMGANASDYCQEMDDLRNRALELIEILENKA